MNQFLHGLSSGYIRFSFCSSGQLLSTVPDGGLSCWHLCSAFRIPLVALFDGEGKGPLAPDFKSDFVRLTGTKLNFRDRILDESMFLCSLFTLEPQQSGRPKSNPDSAAPILVLRGDGFVSDRYKPSHEKKEGTVAPQSPTPLGDNLLLLKRGPSRHSSPMPVTVLSDPGPARNAPAPAAQAHRQICKSPPTLTVRPCLPVAAIRGARIAGRRGSDTVTAAWPATSRSRSSSLARHESEST